MLIFDFFWRYDERDRDKERKGGRKAVFLCFFKCWFSEGAGLKRWLLSCPFARAEVQTVINVNAYTMATENDYDTRSIRYRESEHQQKKSMHAKNIHVYILKGKTKDQGERKNIQFPGKGKIKSNMSSRA